MMGSARKSQSPAKNIVYCCRPMGCSNILQLCSRSLRAKNPPQRGEKCRPWAAPILISGCRPIIVGGVISFVPHPVQRTEPYSVGSYTQKARRRGSEWLSVRGEVREASVPIVSACSAMTWLYLHCLLSAAVSMSGTCSAGGWMAPGFCR